MTTWIRWRVSTWPALTLSLALAAGTAAVPPPSQAPDPPSPDSQSAPPSPDPRSGQEPAASAQEAADPTREPAPASRDWTAAVPPDRRDGAVSPELVALEEAAAAAPDDLLAGAAYRQRCIAEEAYDRCLARFEALAQAHPESAAVQLNWGYAFVDKIPSAGAVTQVILADSALKRFTAALEIEASWLALYTRGNSYVYWPAIFGRTPLGIADLERAVALSEELGSDAPAYHALAYAALGDGHWRLEEIEAARERWRRGLERFPGAAELRARLERDGEALDAYLEEHYAIGERVDTSLAELGQGAR